MHEVGAVAKVVLAARILCQRNCISDLKITHELAAAQELAEGGDGCRKSEILRRFRKMHSGIGAQDCLLLDKVVAEWGERGAACTPSDTQLLVQFDLIRIQRHVGPRRIRHAQNTLGRL